MVELFNQKSARKSSEIKRFLSFLWWTVQDSNPSSGFRVLFCRVLRSFFVLSVQCIVLFDALWVLAMLLP